VPDFSNLSRLALVPGKSSRFIFYEVEGRPWIEGLSMTETNRAYTNARLKKNRRFARVKQLDAHAIAESRRIDKELFVLHVARDWFWPEKDGSEVPFTPENLSAMLEALPDWLFDRMAEHFRDEGNFVEDAKTDVEETAGN
jgi:hypothetical protein